MPSLRRLRLTVGLALLIALATVPSAHAAVTLGSDLSTPPNQSSEARCPVTGCTVFQVKLAHRILVAPFDGVATSWSVRSADPYRGLQLNLLRYAGPGSVPVDWIKNVGLWGPNVYRNIARAQGNIAPGVSTFKLRMPVREGDRFGLGFPTSSGLPPRLLGRFSTGSDQGSSSNSTPDSGSSPATPASPGDSTTIAPADPNGKASSRDGSQPEPYDPIAIGIKDDLPRQQPQDQTGIFAPDHPIGAELTYVMPPDASVEVLSNVTLEPDRDHDGWGDETQDNCPTVANRSQQRRQRFAHRLGDACGPQATLAGSRTLRLGKHRALRLRGRARAGQHGVRWALVALIRRDRTGCTSYRSFFGRTRHPHAASVSCTHPALTRVRVRHGRWQLRARGLEPGRYALLLGAVDRTGVKTRLYTRRLHTRLRLRLRAPRKTSQPQASQPAA